jgi:carnitine O-acetyltransferase
MQGLRMLIKEDEEMPQLFKDPSYSNSGRWIMSTSQIPGEHFDGYGWGEVDPEGFGIPYMINKFSLHFTVTSRHMGSDLLCKHIKESLDAMDELCKSMKLAKSKL